jgi:TATA-binding protein-associated factor
MLQRFLTAVVAEEWAKQYEDSASESALSLVATSSLAREIATKTLDWLQGKTPPAYHEMALALNRIHMETVSLLQMFATDCKLPRSSVPFLGNEIDITGTKQKAFTIDRANWALDREYTRLKDSLGRTKKRELGVIAEKRTAVLANIARYNETKAQHDIRVSAAFAAAFVAFKSPPDKVSPVVKGMMNGIKVGSVVSRIILR